MKYIIFTCDGYGLPIAHHLLQEGNEVIVGQVINKKTTLTKVESRSNNEESALDQKRRLNLYKNMIEKVPADVLVRRMKRIKNRMLQICTCSADVSRKINFNIFGKFF